MEYIKHQSHELRVNNNYFVVLLWRDTSPQALVYVVSHKIRVGFSDVNLDAYLVVSTVERCCKTTNTMDCRFTTVTYLTALRR